jgi:hypothetical protein
MPNLEEFKQLVAEGKIKDKWYFYKRTEQQKQRQALEMSKLSKYFKDTFNVILYPMYGTLLGIIRDSDFIPHDNDVDLAYLSLKTNKEEVLKEFEYICNVLKKNNFLTKILRKGQLHCYGESKTFKYDIWTSFLLDDKYCIIPLIDKDIESSVILPFITYKFRNIELLIPGNSPKLLDYIYKNWKTPVRLDWSKHQCKKIL